MNASSPHHLGYNKNVLMSIIVISSFINPFLGGAVNIALPQIATTFTMGVTGISWVAMSFLLSSAVFLLPLGKMADIVGRRKVFLVGNVIIAIASILCMFSVSSLMLITARVIQGIGSAMVFGTGMAIITSAFPPHQRGKAIGLNVSAVYLGLSVAPLLGGFLTQTFGWQSLFGFSLLLSSVAAIFTLISIKTEWKDAHHETFDLTGSFVYTLSVFALMFGFSKLPETFAILLTIMGILGLVVFVKLELKTEFPVLNIRLFLDNRVFAYSNLAALINYAATFAITFLLSLYLQYVKGLSPQHAGLILVASPIVMTIVASFSGRMSDKHDPRILASLGMGILVTGLIFLVFLSDYTSNFYIIFCLIILGCGFGLFSSPNTNSVMSSVEKKHLGVASATVGTMRLTGQMFSMGLAALALHAFVGNVAITPENHASFMIATKSVFSLFSLLCIAGVFASLARGKKQDAAPLP
jgi:EmrB/QacA subfamily drug resistance transporter